MQIVIDGTLTHYHDINPDATKTILVLHGWANTSENWLTVAQHLPTNYRYLLIDLPGFGQTEHLPGKPNVPEYTEFIASFIDKLHLQNPILFGHSFGGQIALDLALKQPTKISGLILFSPAGVRLRSRYVRYRLKVFKLLRFFKKFLPPSFYRYLLTKMGSADYANAMEKHRDILKQIVNYDLSTKLKEITLPTTIIWGSEDRVIPYKGKFLAENIPNSQLVILYGMGHIANILQPLDMATELTKVINDL